MADWFHAGAQFPDACSPRGARRNADAEALFHPHQGKGRDHLQAQRALRSGRPEEDQHIPARLAPQRADQDGSAPARPGLGSLQGRRRARLHPRRLGLSLAGDQLDAAQAQQGRRQQEPAHARQGDGFLHSGRQPEEAARCGTEDAGRRRRLLSAFGFALRASRCRQCPSLAAHEPQGTGRGVPERQDAARAERRQAAARIRDRARFLSGAQEERRHRAGACQLRQSTKQVRRPAFGAVRRRRGRGRGQQRGAKKLPQPSRPSPPRRPARPKRLAISRSFRRNSPIPPI